MMPGDEKYGRPIGVLLETGEKGGRPVAGHINLKRGSILDSNVLSIYHDEHFRVREHGDLRGVTEAGKISLLDCVSLGVLTHTRRDSISMHHGDVPFRYAVFGDKHISSDEKTVRGIQFKLEGLESTVFMQDDIDKFGYISNPDSEIVDAIRRKRPDYLKGNLVTGKAKVSYFTGEWYFLPKFETVLGTIHVGRTMKVKFNGKQMKDAPYIAIDFDADPTSLEGAWKKMRTVRQFFAWVMGYAPAWSDVVIFTSQIGEKGYRVDDCGHPDGGLEAFGSREWEDVPSYVKQYGTLIDASSHADHFIAVMRKWLERNCDTKRRSANACYFGTLAGMHKSTIENGITIAVNAFDLLPAEDKPSVVPLSDKSRMILDDASREIKKLPSDNTERNEVLNALGRIKTDSPLRRTVEHRAKVVTSYFGEEKLKGLEEIIRIAVQCRNYYTHGSSDRNVSEVDFTDSELVLSLTHSLEFIYAASELLLCGWDASTTLRESDHPLGGYLNMYDYHRTKLKASKRRPSRPSY